MDLEDPCNGGFTAALEAGECCINFSKKRRSLLSPLMSKLSYLLLSYLEPAIAVCCLALCVQPGKVLLCREKMLQC